MKIRIISLSLALLFISIITFEYISNTAVAENTSSKTIEYVLEKRVVDKFIDDDYIPSYVISILLKKSSNIPKSKKVIYNYLDSNTILRPPIQA